jgi:Mg-chelatase subunit ChlD
MTRRVRFRVVDERDAPLHDAEVFVVAGGVRRAAGHTRADGYWDLFPGVSCPTLGGPAEVYVRVGTVTRVADVTLPQSGDSRDIHVRVPGVSAPGPTALDVVFLVDVTGSMSDELVYVREEVVGIVDRVRQAMPQVSVRVGATLYRDRGDEVRLLQVPLTASAEAFAASLRHVDAEGGGDYPEDLNAGLGAALRTQQWREGGAARVLVLIADAPPQRYPDAAYTYREGMAEASARGIRILPVAASGADRTVELLFRSMGAFTGTPYVYLTDDSGVGGAHLEADTDRIAVEMFSDLLTRLLVSELQGRGMHEPEHVERAFPGA